MIESVTGEKCEGTGADDEIKGVLIGGEANSAPSSESDLSEGNIRPIGVVASVVNFAMGATSEPFILTMPSSWELDLPMPWLSYPLPLLGDGAPSLAHLVNSLRGAIS